MVEFVSFKSLRDGELFFARGRLHCKSDEGIHQIPSEHSRFEGYNAFFDDGEHGVWAHFDDAVLVQKYEEAKHGNSDYIIYLRDLFYGPQES